MGILKNQLPNSTLGLKGKQPKKSEGLNTFQQPGSFTNLPKSLQHSRLDLDGKTPEGYKAPERGIDDRLRDLTD